MNEKLLKAVSKSIDTLSAFIAARKGLLPILGILLIIANFLITLFVPGFLSDSNLFLHAGVIIAIIGFMLAWAL